MYTYKVDNDTEIVQKIFVINETNWIYKPDEINRNIK